MSFLSSVASVVEFLIRWREIIFTKTCRIIKKKQKLKNKLISHLYPTIYSFSSKHEFKLKALAFSHIFDNTANT